MFMLIVLSSFVFSDTVSELDTKTLWVAPLNFSTATYGTLGGVAVTQNNFGVGAFGNYIYNSGIDFDGSNDYINFNINPNELNMYNGYVVSFWANVSQDSGAYLWGASMGSTTDAAIFVYYAGVNAISFIHRDDDGNAGACGRTATNATLFDGNMHHFILQYSSSKNAIYLWIDGVGYNSAGTQACSKNSTITYDLWLGDMNWGGGGLGVYKTGVAQFEVLKIQQAAVINRTVIEYLMNSTYPRVQTPAANNPPELVYNNTTPDNPSTTDNLLFNITCTDSDAGDTITGYVQLYKNGTAYGSAHSSVVTNNTNTLIYTLAYTNTSYSQNWTGEYWCGDGTDNSAKQNDSVTIADEILIGYLNTIAASLLPAIAYTNDTLLGFCSGNSSSSLNYNVKFYKNASLFNQIILNSKCNDEFANSTDYCFDSINGSYSVYGNWTPVTVAGGYGYDGLYNTFLACDQGINVPCYMDINYTQPKYINLSSIWTVKDNGAERNTTLNSQCINQNDNTISLRVKLNRFGGGPADYRVTYYCKNETEWLQLLTATGSLILFYEERMNWVYDSDFFIGVNNTLTNVYNVSSSQTTNNDQFILSCQALNETDSSIWVNSTSLIINNSLPYLTNLLPLDNYKDNEMANITFTLRDNDVLDFHLCLFYFNGTLIQSKGPYYDGDNVWFQMPNVTDGTYIWNITCPDEWGFNTVSRTFTIDRINPIIRFFNPESDNSTSINTTTLDTYIQVDDLNLYWATINVTNPAGTNILSMAYNLSSVQIYDINETVTNGLTGNYTVFIMAADSHTKNEIPEFDVKKSWFSEKLTFDFNGNIEIYPENSYLKDSFATKQKDRYSISYKRKNNNRINNYDSFIVESNSYIDILNSNYAGHLIIKEGSPKNWKWLDFETTEKYNVKIERITDNKVRVYVYSDKNKDLTFNSLGLLNIAYETVTYYYNNLTESTLHEEDNNILCGHYNVYYVNYTYNDAIHKPPIGAKLSLNGTNYTATLLDYVNTNYRFSVNKSVNCFDELKTNITNIWHINKKYLNDSTYYDTTEFYQDVYSPSFGVCNENLTVKILNMTYKNDYLLNNIAATNQFSLSFDDGELISSAVGTATNNFTHFICTDINTSLFNLNYSAYGNFLLSSTGYISKTVTYTAESSINLTNANQYNLTFYMIDLNSSGTITFNWYTEQYVPITGTMNVYTCNDDGTQTLFESTEITSGTAFVNLRLLIQRYSYTVEYKNKTYSQPSFSNCHVENALERTFYVDVLNIDMSPTLGLYFVDCALVKTNASTNEITMYWSNNIADDDNITACIVGKRYTIYNYTEVYRNCSTAPMGSFVVTVPNNGNNYDVVGEISQNGHTGYCRDVINFNSQSDSNTLLGYSGVFAVILLIISMILFYNGDGEKQIIIALASLLLSYLVGIIAMGWLTMTSILSFALVLLLIGRYFRKT